MIEDDAENAAEMVRAAGFIHPAEVIEAQAATIERLQAVLAVIADGEGDARMMARMSLMSAKQD